MMIAGIQSGMPSGATSVNENSATSANSTVMIGTSAVTSAGARGVVRGAAPRTDAIRTAIPTEPLTILATQPNAAERKQTPSGRPCRRRPARQIAHASVRVSSAPIWSSTDEPDEGEWSHDEGRAELRTTPGEHVDQ